MDSEKKFPEAIVTLWVKEGQKGPYFSGVANVDIPKGTQIYGLKNNRKEKDTHPDYRLFKSEPREKPAPKQTPADFGLDN